MASHSSTLAWKIPWMEKPGRLQSMNSAGQNVGVNSLSLLQGIFPTQGSNPGLLHCRQIFLPSEPPGKTPVTFSGFF